jgi:hypothetical protein
MTCALCNKKEANKKNTHYLTDAIIRTCLNLNGENVRESGFYFDLSDDSIYSKFNFQRQTSVEKLTESLKREPTEDEIEAAKIVPFSVDNVFCNECEDIFSEIENIFLSNYLPAFRNSDLTDILYKEFADSKSIRLFFIIQVWRTCICVPYFTLPPDCVEDLRTKILNFKDISNEDLLMYPLSVTYLQTLGGQKEYTSNFIVIPNDVDPNIIVFNDFAIQFYSNNKNVKFASYHGLNISSSFNDYLNSGDGPFKIKILNNDERKAFLRELLNEIKVKTGMADLRENFIRGWRYFSGYIPPYNLVDEYVRFITGIPGFDILQFSKERIAMLTAQFIAGKLGR